MKDTSIKLLEAVVSYYKGNGKYNFSGLQGQDRADAAYDAWTHLFYDIEDYLKNRPCDCDVPEAAVPLLENKCLKCKRRLHAAKEDKVSIP